MRRYELIQVEGKGLEGWALKETPEGPYVPYFYIEALRAKLEQCERELKEAKHPRIATRCPSCGSSTLVIGGGNWLVCSLIGCQDPTLINSAGERLKTHFADRLKAEAERDAALARVKEVEAKYEAASFWKYWAYPHGATAEQVQDELTDYAMILDNVSKVYGHITGGRISKPNTHADAVKAAADDENAKAIECETEELAKRLTDLETALAALPLVEGEIGVPETIIHDIHGKWHSIQAPVTNLLRLRQRMG